MRNDRPAPWKIPDEPKELTEMEKEMLYYYPICFLFGFVLDADNREIDFFRARKISIMGKNRLITGGFCCKSGSFLITYGVRFAAVFMLFLFG